MPDEFGPREEADAYRVYLYLSEAPEHGVIKTILRMGDDASVSFAVNWLHEEQPKPLVGGVLFDCWRVEKFTREHTYEVIATGVAERECRLKSNRRKSFREWQDDQTGATEIRNGIRTLDKEATSGRRTGGRGLARRGKGRKQRSPRALTPLQQRMAVIKEQASKAVREGDIGRRIDPRERFKQLTTPNSPTGSNDSYR